MQDLLDEWLICGWQSRPHDSLRDPWFPKRAISPNDAYAAMVAAAGYLPVTLTGEDYLELLPVTWRAINDYGIRINYRTYDVDYQTHGPDPLGRYRRQPSPVTAKRGLWEVHYDPYDVSQVFLRTTEGWITVPWTHRSMVTGPFADFTWNQARQLVAERGGDGTDETAVARAVDDLLTRCERGPGRRNRATTRLVARTKVAATTHRPPTPQLEIQPAAADSASATATAVPFGIFDADAEADRWL